MAVFLTGTRLMTCLAVSTLDSSPRSTAGTSMTGASASRTSFFGDAAEEPAPDAAAAM